MSVVAAEVELLILRRSLPASDAEGLFTIAPRLDALTAPEAALVMAGIPKPLKCTAEITAGGILSVLCSPIVAGADAALFDVQVRSFYHLMIEARKERDLQTANARLLVRRPGQSMLVPELGFERWYREYQAPEGLALGFRRPDDAERADGADQVVEVYRTEPL